MTSFNDALIEIEAALPKVTWREGVIGLNNNLEKRVALEELSFRVFEGEADGWKLLACTWHEKHDPPKDRSFDGTATKGGVILHLTLDLAIKAVKLAEEQCRTR